MKSEKVRFRNDAGAELVAVFEWPEDEQPHGFALFAHCFTCTKNIAATTFSDNVADKCPVHRTLHQQVKISTRLQD